MFVSANVDLAAYRSDLSSPTPERDLSTFIDQVQRVSLQVGAFDDIFLGFKWFSSIDPRRCNIISNDNIKHSGQTITDSGISASRKNEKWYYLSPNCTRIATSTVVESSKFETKIWFFVFWFLTLGQSKFAAVKNCSIFFEPKSEWCLQCKDKRF